MKKSSFLTVMLAVAIAAFTFSCKQQENNVTPAPVTKNGISQQVIDNFLKLGIDARDAKYGEVTNPLTGKTQVGYTLEGDMFVSKEKYDEMLTGDVIAGLNGEQYRTSNLVSNNQTIDVIGYTANNSNGLSSTLQNGLRWAVDNYNRLNIGLRFNLTFGTNFQPKDIVVYQVSGNGGGSAGFPSGGAPYKWVQIQAGTANFGTNVAEHVIGHEIGHCLGLRHTDYFNRSISCGSGGNEGSAGVGAIQIAGTPGQFNIDMNSLMLACFSSNEDGEFSNFDIIALENLY
ncbi:M57 family metalloprotease [Microscilla marina]|nr:M57 family metalloprotease [Microscilla marina]